MTHSIVNKLSATQFPFRATDDLYSATAGAPGARTLSPISPQPCWSGKSALFEKKWHTHAPFVYRTFDKTIILIYLLLSALLPPFNLQIQGRQLLSSKPGVLDQFSNPASVCISFSSFLTFDAGNTPIKFDPAACRFFLFFLLFYYLFYSSSLFYSKPLSHLNAITFDAGTLSFVAHSLAVLLLLFFLLRYFIGPPYLLQTLVGSK